jgi:hypothetical protein
MKIEEQVDHPDMIEKEIIHKMSFPKFDVLNNATDRITRQRHTERAAILGNGYQCKVQIVFMTADEEIKMVETTIWDADSQYITLKSGTLIPVTAILKIEF